MKEEKRNFKEEIKDFWKDEGPKIKIGIGCLSLGFLIGFAKGVLTESRIWSQTTYELIIKKPNEPDEDNDEI